MNNLFLEYAIDEDDIIHESQGIDVQNQICTKIETVIPKNADKTIVFAEISDTSHDIFFYSYINSKPHQCYKLAEDGVLDANNLDIVFDQISNIIKRSGLYVSGKCNIVTIVLEKRDVKKISVEYFNNKAGLYNIKKEWKKEYIK